MKKLYSTILILLATASCFASDGFFESIKNSSSKNQKTIIIFYKSDCEFCKKMNDEISANAIFITELVKNYTVQALDITSAEGRLLADKFNIHAVPTIVNLDNATGASTVIKGFGSIEKLSNKLGLVNTINKPQTTVEKKSLAGCGDGVIDAGEQCDQGGGNVSNGDGCSSTCQIEAGFTCSGTPSVCTMTAVCGDGVIAGTEQCDDGNTANGDGCSATCTVQTGFSCSGNPSICTSVCGDGIVVGTEQCDDGNLVNGDGCSATCIVQVGYSCSGNPSNCSTICGDGTAAGAEQCDDGNVANGDGCSSTCQIENVAPSNDECTSAITISNTIGNIAGNNSVATNSAIAAPACGSIINDLWYSFTISSTQIVRIAANGGTAAVDPLMAIYSGTCGTLTYIICDDDGGPGSNSLIQTTLTAGTYFIRVGSFSLASKGNFSLVYNLNSPNICGNGLIELTEECDDGNTNDNDGCSNICKVENASTIVGVGINRDSTRANPSAMLDVKSFDKGVLIPRMSTAQKAAIASPAKGLLVFDITTNSFWFYNGTAWVEIGKPAGSTGVTGSGLPAGTTSQTLRNNGTNWVSNSILQNDGINVTVTGQMKITGGSPSIGKVLTSDNVGLATWQTLGVGTASFSVRLDSNRTLVDGAAAIRMHFGNYGTGVGNFISASSFNSTNDEFVATVAGLYVFNIDVYLVPLATTDYNVLTQIRVDNSSNVAVSQVGFVDFSSLGTLNAAHGHMATLNLNVGDKVYVLAGKFNGGGTSNIIVSNGGGGIVSTRFSGYRIN